MKKTSKAIQRLADNIWVFIASIFFLAWYYGGPIYHGIFADRTPPIKVFHSAEALNSPILDGSPLVVRIVRDKVRDDCPVTSRRWITSEDGIVYNLGVASWAGGDVEAGWLDFAYPMPDGLSPGSYNLNVHLSYQCPNVSEPFEYEQPTVRFRVVEKPINQEGEETNAE